MFFFSSRNQHPRILWIPVRFPRSPALPGSPEIFFLVLSVTPCQGSHVICPPVTGFHPKARRNMACGKYSAKHMEMAPPSRKIPRNPIDLLKTFQIVQSSGFPQRSIPSLTASGLVTCRHLTPHLGSRCGRQLLVDTSNLTNSRGHPSHICPLCLKMITDRQVGVIRPCNHILHAAASGLYMSTCLRIINNKPS